MKNTEYNDITKTGTQGLEGLKGVNTKKDNFNQFFNSIGSMNLTQLSEAFSPQGYTYIGNQLAEAGYGQSKYDEHAVTLSDLRDLNETRAQQQSGWAQLGAGLTKMSILATTTFVDGILGTLAGLINLGYQAVAGNIHSAGEALWSFIDNPFSEVLTEINDQAESWVPNYYTQEEQNSPWYSNIISANFIGDKFLKNLGFTVGAAVTAFLTSGAASRVLVKKGVREAFKGAVVTAAGKELKTGAEIYKAYKTGDAIIDGAKLTEDLAKSAKKLRNAERQIKLIAGVASAAGEGRIEAINNVNNWKKNIISNLEEQHNNYPVMLEEQLYQEHPEWFSIDSQGNKFISNYEGAKHYQEQITKEKENYEKARIQIDKEKVAVGNSIFGLNLALLSGSNIWQWGRALTGSFTAARTGKSLVKGSIKEGFAANKGLVRKTRIRAISSPLMEIQEEMSQAAIAEGSGMWKSSKINHDFGSFYGGKIDPDAEEDVQSWLGSIVSGFANTYGDINNWEEGFIGGLTGLLGIPKIKIITKVNGKKGLSVKFDGELWQGFKDAKEYAKEGKEIADYLNSRIQDPEFLNYYQGTIRHIREGNRMDDAAEKGDEFEFKNAKHSQIISDAIMFEKAGKLQEFLDMIDETATISDEDIEQIKKETIDKKTGKSIFDGMTNEQIKQQIKKQAENTRKTVEKYSKISTDLRALYGNNVSQDVLEELIWGMSQVDNWETRIGQMYGDIREKLKGVAQELKDKHGVDIEVVLNNIEDFQNAFLGDSNLVDKINEIVSDKNAPLEEKEAAIVSAIKEKQEQTKRNSLALGRKILKIRKKAEKAQNRIKKQIAKLQKEKQRLTEIRDLEKEDHKKYIEETLNSLIDEYSKLLKEISDRGNIPGFGQIHKENFEKQIKEGFDRLEENSADADDYFDSVFSQLNDAIRSIEEEIAVGALKDKRFKKGYDPTTKLVVGENGNLMSEAESEERTATRIANESLAEQIVKLKEEVESLKNNKVNPIDVEKISKQLIDMIKILAARSKFLDTYKALEEHPELFDDKIQQERDEAVAKYKEKQVQRELKKINKQEINNVQDLRKVLNSIEDKNLIEDVLKSLKEGASDELKQIIKDFENIEEMRDILNSAISNIQCTTEEQLNNVKEATTIINDTLEEAKTFKEAQNNLQSAIIKAEANNPEVAEIINQTLDQYDEVIKSVASKKKDKKAKKKIKKKANPEEDGEIDEDEDEDEDEESSQPKKKKSAFESLAEDDDNPFSDENNDEYQEETQEPEIEDDEEIVRTLKKMEEDELQDVIDNKSDILKDLSDKNKKAVIQLATNILNRKKNPLLNFGRKNSGENSAETNSEIDSKPNKTEQSKYTSWVETGYDIDKAKSKQRKAVLRRTETADALRALGAFDFVDSGKLGDLLYANAELPIHYIVAPNKTGLGNIVLLAIEVTSGVKAINPIIAQDGKKYQIVGSLGSYNKDRTATENRIAIYEQIVKEKGDNGSEYFVSKKYINKVSHIYSGRMIKSTETSGSADSNERKLKDILNGEKPLFGFYYSEFDFRIPGLSEEERDNKVVALNTNNMNPREGSIWLITKEADGRYYAKALNVRKFTNEEWNFKEHENTPIMKSIKQSIKILFDSEASDYERMVARDNLESILYFDKYKIVFNEGIVSIKNSEGKNVFNNIGEKTQDIDEKIQDMLSALDTLKLRFQISPSPISSDISGIYVEDIVESDIVSTDLAMLHNVNASFDMPLLDVKTGNPLLNVSPSEIRGHTGKKGINNTNSVTSIFINGVRYLLNNDNTVTDTDGETVSNKIAEQVLFKNKIMNKKVQPVNGNSNLYVSAYSNSKKFGIYNNRVVEGKELEELLKEANEEAQKQEISKNLNTSDENPFANENNDEQKNNDENYTEDEDNDDDLLGSGDIQEGTGFFGENEKQEDEDNPFGDEDNDETDESKETKKETPNDNLTEVFNPEIEKNRINYSTVEILFKNIQLLQNNGFPTPAAFEQAVEAKGININSIQSEEDLLSVLNKIKCG